MRVVRSRESLGRKGRLKMGDAPTSLWIGVVVVGIMSGVIGGLVLVLVIERIWRGVERRRVTRAWDEVDKARRKRRVEDEERERREYEEREQEDKARVKARGYIDGLRRNGERMQDRMRRVRGRREDKGKGEGE